MLADAKAVDLLRIAERNLSEEGAQYVLGSGSDYSLADVFMTTFLTRLLTNGGLFKKEVVAKRPIVDSYFKRMKERPSYQEAMMSPFTMPDHYKIFGILFLIMFALTWVLVGIFAGAGVMLDATLTQLWFTFFLLILTIVSLLLICWKKKGDAQFKKMSDYLNEHVFKDDYLYKK